MSGGTGAPLSGGPLHADLERLYRIPLAEGTLPGALFQADPPSGTPAPVPAATPGHGQDPVELGQDPVELVERALERIAATDGELRAWALVDAEGARAQAEAARARAERGGGGPLHGLPVGVKDLIDVAGLPTGGGSRTPRPRPGRVPAPAR